MRRILLLTAAAMLVAAAPPTPPKTPTPAKVRSPGDAVKAAPPTDWVEIPPADLLVMDLKSTPAIEFRLRHCESLEEMLFVQMTLGDDRAIRETWVAGVRVHQRP